MTHDPANVARIVGRAAVTTASQTYPTAKMLAHARLRYAGKRGPSPLVVYQMGKVGSQAIIESLRSAMPGRSVLQVHTLVDERLAREEASYRKDPDGAQRAGHVWASQYVRQRLRRHPGEGWDLVSVVREPVARNISSFFQIADRIFGPTYWQQRLAEPDDVVLDRLEHDFLERYDDHDIPIEWFDAELRRFFGIDVYGSAFPHKTGYQILHGERARVLVLRLESLANCAPQAFDEFLGLRHFHLTSRNVALDKRYARLYRLFGASATLPGDYLDRIYSSTYVRHFYDGTEIEAFRNRWSHP